MEKVYVAEGARASAIALSEMITVDGGNRYVLFTMKHVNGQWFVSDIDLEEQRSLKVEVKQFLRDYPKARQE